MPGAGTGSVGQQEQLRVEPGEPHPRMPLNFGTGVQEVVSARGKSVLARPLGWTYPKMEVWGAAPLPISPEKPPDLYR